MIYNWLIKHKKSAYGIAIGFLIFTILVYAFQSCWFVKHVYKYIDYWAIPLSAAFMLALAYMAYISIAENRRERIEERHRQALERIRSWAEESFDAVARPTTQQQLSQRLTELVVRLQPSSVKSIGILSDAKQLGGSLDAEVITANVILNKFIARLMGEEEITSFKSRFEVKDTITPISNKQDLQDSKRELLNALKEVINSVTERLVPTR